ncbi:MAG TPA: hypothetical protein VMZ04_06010, partial [Anaerolineae bacterium]|nr:hypothetical protein [Anaerolineae bacterium]
FDRYFDLKYGLESIFCRKFDVIQSGAIRNPYLRAYLDKDRISIYIENNDYISVAGYDSKPANRLSLILYQLRQITCQKFLN